MHTGLRSVEMEALPEEGRIKRRLNEGSPGCTTVGTEPLPSAARGAAGVIKMAAEWHQTESTAHPQLLTREEIERKRKEGSGP